METDKAIWTNIRQRSIPLRVQQFLFNTIHGTYRLGKFWDNIPECEYRAWCPQCIGVKTETLKHILLKCNNRTVT